jgi:hypothetical protein
MITADSGNFAEKLKTMVQGFVGLNLCLMLTAFLVLKVNALTGLAAALTTGLLLLAAGFQKKQKVLLWSAALAFCGGMTILLWGVMDLTAITTGAKPLKQDNPFLWSLALFFDLIWFSGLLAWLYHDKKTQRRKNKPS